MPAMPPPARPTDPPALTAAEFEAAYRRLLSAQGGGGANAGCIACERCEACAGCTFCADSKSLTRCHYCAACQDCAECAHCVRCRGCLQCQHCVDSERCVGGAYLVRCVGCTGCTYCFGCVGLGRRDFHILNEPYDRATYFALTSRLARDLRIAMP